MRAQIADTKIATIVVSNIPAAPEPIFAKRSVAAVAPVASMITEPVTIPIKRTTNTLIPMIPPTNTSTYGIIWIKLYSPPTPAPTSKPKDCTSKITSVANAAGSAIQKFSRNLSFMAQP